MCVTSSRSSSRSSSRACVMRFCAGNELGAHLSSSMDPMESNLRIPCIVELTCKSLVYKSRCRGPSCRSRCRSLARILRHFRSGAVPLETPNTRARINGESPRPESMSPPRPPALHPGAWHGAAARAMDRYPSYGDACGGLHPAPCSLPHDTSVSARAFDGRGLTQSEVGRLSRHASAR